MGRARISVDVEREDRLLAGLTARQLGILAGAGVVAWLVGAAVRTVLGAPAAIAVAWPVLLVGLALALGRRDGLSLDRLVLAAWRHRRAPRWMVPAPEGVQPAPGLFAEADAGGVRPAPLELPVVGVSQEGVLDLGADGAAVLCRASGLVFSLRTEAEQDGLVQGFARLLHSVTAPLQVLVRAVPVDLAGMIAAIEQAAGGLPHPALEAAAREHAGFLSELAARRDVLGREILVVLRELTTGSAAAEVLGRRAEQAASLLAGAGVMLRRLDGEQAMVALAQSMRPDSRPRPAGGQHATDRVITGGAR
jgi:PrgI family protein